MSRERQNGTILKGIGGFYYVACAGRVVECKASGRLRLGDLLPLAGDHVEIEIGDDGDGFIVAICPRKNTLVRPPVANVDQIVIVASEAPPITDPYLIDRIMTIAELQSCEPVVCINKCDLDPAESLQAIYHQAGMRTICVSAETGEGIEALLPLLSHKLSAFTGNSGVGKSSIINMLEPSISLSTGEVSEKLGRGRHTTRHVEIFPLGGDALVIDTPGFSSFDTEELNLELKENLPETFPEFRPFLGQCRFVGCTHTKEKGCAVRQAVRDGIIPESRHKSYLRLFEELKSVKAWEERKGIK